MIPAILLIVVIALTMSMAGCTGDGDSGTTSDSETPSQDASDGDSGEKAHPILNLRTSTDIQTLDIHMTNSPYDYFVSTQIFEGFLRFPEGGNVQSAAEPALASEYSVNDTGDEVTLTLREGVKWHDGSLLTIDDAMYTIERWLTSSFTKTKMTMIDHAEKIDDKTLKIVLKGPYPTFTTLLCGWPYRLVQKAACEKNGIDQPLDETSFIGTGPYKFEKNVIGEGVTLVANKDWWDGEPYFEGINFKLIADETTAMTALVNGELDLNTLMTGLDVQEVENSSNLQLIEKPKAGAYLVDFNLNEPPFDNDKVREAINYGINREVYSDLVWDGITAGVCSQQLTPEEEGYLGEDLVFEYDVEKAKQLIKESGLSAGDLKFDLLVPTSYSGPALGATFKEDMAAIGVDVNIVELEPGAHTAAQYSKEYEAFYSYVGNVNYCPPYHRNLYYRSGGVMTPWVKEMPEIDALIDEANVEMDDAKRVSIYEDIERFIRENNLWAPIDYLQADFGAAKQLKNVTFEAGTLCFNTGLWSWEE
jgi:peptide/nickel transport system substrate-binding protein